jgi:RNA-directed DNA polymerase
MSLRPPEKVGKLQAALRAKAKEQPSYRFYALYDKLWRKDVLEYAYDCCKANGGAAGVDGTTFADIEAAGRAAWLDELAQSLRKKTYQTQAVRRVHIPKADGKQRPLGIPTIRDRVAQMAAVIVLGPIFDEDLCPQQYAYRPGRNALDAVRAVHRLIQDGHGEVVDADLSGYFDSIPHAELMKSLSRRISDGAMLALLKQWLEAPVEETDEHGRRQRTTRSRDDGRGVPQGAPISPLLSNVYMRRFVLGWTALGHEKRLDAHLVNYADDFVICCRGTGREAAALMRGMMERLRLTVNQAKTRLCRLPEESFDFLGYTIGRCYWPQTGRAYLGTRPSPKRIARLCEAIHTMTERSCTYLADGQLIAQLNRVLVGWANYFCLGPVSKAYRAVDAHVLRRVRQWLRTKHRWRGSPRAHWPEARLYNELGLVRLAARTYRCYPSAKA